MCISVDGKAVKILASIFLVITEIMTKYMSGSIFVTRCLCYHFRQRKEVMFLPRSVCLSAILLKKNYERILMIFGGVGVAQRTID